MAERLTAFSAVDINAGLIRRLVAAQFPEWSHLGVRKVVPGGWDNRTFRLGRGLAARLPSAARYAAQASKEVRWLPRLAPKLPIAIPRPVALGSPGCGFPWRWSVNRWLNGETANENNPVDTVELARQLALFLRALQDVDTAGGPPPGAHNFFRGGALTVYDQETRSALDALHGVIDTRRAASIWQAALDATWRGRPVWVHGDVAAGNLLLRDGRLSAVIDFGCCAVGDPACDLVIAWTLLAPAARGEFREALGADPATWTRARGWALWKALIQLRASHMRGEQDGPLADQVQVILEVA